MFNRKLRKQLAEANARIAELEKARIEGLSISEIIWLKAEITRILMICNPMKAIDLIILNFDNKISKHSNSLK